MREQEYRAILAYMDEKLDATSHDAEHTRRVLFNALEIAQGDGELDLDVLIAACLLHDVARPDEAATGCDHAAVGAVKAYDFLCSLGWPEDRAAHVREVISTHRFRGTKRPTTKEAEILYDADKIDSTGAIGVARSLFYNGEHHQPLYRLEGTRIAPPEGTRSGTFFDEYVVKLSKIPDVLLTERGRALVEKRAQVAAQIYEAMVQEIEGVVTAGEARLCRYLEK